MITIRETFEQLNGRKALIAYITAGDPDLSGTLQLMHSLADNDADIIELGVPFSDPMADGPTIQRATERALANGVSLQDVLDMVHRFRSSNQTTPVILMGYLNPIHKMGYTEFARRPNSGPHHHHGQDQDQHRDPKRRGEPAQYGWSRNCR